MKRRQMRKTTRGEEKVIMMLRKLYRRRWKFNG
jgi:hypothetical protein